MLPLLIILFFVFLELTSSKVIILLMPAHKEELSEDQQQNISKGVDLLNQINEKKAQIQQMEKEAETLNTPSTFAKYSKLQRQINTQKNSLFQLEQELTQIPQQNTSQNQQGIIDNRQEKEKQLVLITNFCLLMVLALILKGTYYTLNALTYDQLKPLSWIIARESEDGSVDISMSIWAIWSFNFIKIIKQALGYEL